MAKQVVQQSIRQEITAGITDGQVLTQTALEAFAYVYRFAIPGVQVPAGLDGGDVPTSGIRVAAGHVSTVEGS